MPFAHDLPERASALKTLAEISKIITTSHDPELTLTKTARMIAERISVDCCSIYVYDQADEQLHLRATFGLNPKTVGNVHLQKTEGLVGLVVQLGEAVQAADMKRHPRFKPIPQTDEDRYCSFLGVPLVDHHRMLGVLTVHTIHCRNFSEEEEHILVTIAGQISTLISKALLIQQLDDSKVTEPLHHSSLRVEGSTMAQGIAMGRAAVIQKNALDEPEKYTDQPPLKERERFREALNSTIADILILIDKVSTQVGADEAAIFHAHLMFLEDSGFQNKILRYIDEGSSAVWSIYQVIQEYLMAFNNIDDPYLREKGDDLKDVGTRLLYHMGHGQLTSMENKGIIVTRQLLPADVAHMDAAKIKGIVTSTGGAASHAAILARSLRIPALCIKDDALNAIQEGDMLALDGGSAYIVINPNDQVVEEFQRLQVEQKKHLQNLEKFNDQPCQTQDGIRIQVMANAGLIGDAELFKQSGAEGIGLYRTEAYFLQLDDFPPLQEQVSVYSKIIDNVKEGDPIVFRTLDIGSDKCSPYMNLPKEENPSLGARAIRIFRNRTEILKTQLKAILMAAQPKCNVQLLFPMITNLEEVAFTRNLYQQCRLELQTEGYDPVELPLGMMFEVPAAVLLADKFASELDFFSIGSNDLTQYLLAVDRNNHQIANMYDPLHPAVLRMVNTLIKEIRRSKKPISLCGEMASDPDGCVLLTGMGLRQLSMDASMIPIIKERMAQITLKDAERLTRRALRMNSSAEVRQMISRHFQHPSLLRT